MTGRPLLVASFLLLAACARTLPPPAAHPDLPPLSATPGGPPLNVTLGPKGREAMIGEFKLAPEGFGIDISKILRDNPSLESGAVWCVEPVSWLGDSLVVSVGLTWWPPGAEPKLPSRSITEALMRCLGYIEGQPWSRATVYLRPGSLPNVVPPSHAQVLTEGTDTLLAAFEEAFLFGVGAPFQVRGLAWNGGTQDGSVEESARGVRRRGEGHVKHQGTTWAASNRLVYSPAPDADSLHLSVVTAPTTVEGVSYVLGKGRDDLLVPTEVGKAAMRLKAGLGKSTVTMASVLRARYSPGLSCVLRALSNPFAAMAATAAEHPDGGTPSADGGSAPRSYPGVDLEAAQKCELSEEDQEGPKRIVR